MIVNLNQKPHQVQEQTTLLDFVSQLDIPTNGIAIAINQNIIKKDHWGSTELQTNDNILIIKATQGG